MRKNWLRFLLAGFCLLLLATNLVGCNSNNKLADTFDQEEVKAAAVQVIELLNDRDIDTLHAIGTEEMRPFLTTEALEQVFTMLDTLGDFTEIKDIKLIGSKDPTTQSEFAVARVETRYGTGAVNYTISFDTEMLLAGLYLR